MDQELPCSPSFLNALPEDNQWALLNKQPNVWSNCVRQVLNCQTILSRCKLQRRRLRQHFLWARKRLLKVAQKSHRATRQPQPFIETD